MRTSYLPVRGSGDGDGRFDILSKAQAGNQVVVKLGQMARAVRIAQRNVGQFWNQIDSPQPFLDRRLEFTLQYVRHAQRRLRFRQVVLLSGCALALWEYCTRQFKKLIKTEQLGRWPTISGVFPSVSEL